MSIKSELIAARARIAKPTDLEVLACVASACAPYSAYINDEVAKLHRARVASGGTGYTPSSALVLRRLRTLTSRGFVRSDHTPIGLYGYRWEITPAGRAALAEASK